MRLTEQVHHELRQQLRAGDTALDATAGNGHDTLAMARLVGPQGRILAIDLQAAAIAATVRAMTFNLGYQPGGDPSITTTADSTVAALDAASTLLAAGGTLCVTAYRGHPGGAAEAEAVATWMTSRSSAHWSVTRHDAQNAAPDSHPPVLWIARKS